MFCKRRPCFGRADVAPLDACQSQQLPRALPTDMLARRQGSVKRDRRAPFHGRFVSIQWRRGNASCSGRVRSAVTMPTPRPPSLDGRESLQADPRADRRVSRPLLFSRPPSQFQFPPTCARGGSAVSLHLCVVLVSVALTSLAPAGVSYGSLHDITGVASILPKSTSPTTLPRRALERRLHSID